MSQSQWFSSPIQKTEIIAILNIKLDAHLGIA